MIPVEYQPTDSRIKIRENGTVQTLCARMGTGGNTVPLVLCPDENDEYVLRKLTPLECCRLQGFPDDWCTCLENDNPTDEELQFWQRVWDYWNDLHGKKRKSLKQIKQWLSKPPTDSAIYKLFGNGICLPCVEYIMDRIVKEEK